MKKIGLIPMDSRPCSYDWPKELGLIANLELVTPPIDYCGTLLKPADYSFMEDWIKQNVSQFDYLIIAADTLFSGGLVQSRHGKLDLNVAYNKLNLFKSLKTINPRIKIYLYDTLMRTSISTVDKKSAENWALMNRYSYYKGQYYLYNRVEDHIKINELLEIIPSEVVDSYHQAREKKHEINKELIKLTHLGVIDYLLILQEDSMPEGIQIVEQRILDQLVNDLNLFQKVKIYNGTDEAACVLVSKIALEQHKHYPKLYLLEPNVNIYDQVMPFEDRPFRENLQKTMDVLNMKCVLDPKEADFVLAIYAENKKVGMEIENHVINKFPTKSKEYNTFIKHLNQFIHEGYPVGLLDLLFPNGGSYDLLSEIEYQKLAAYSAWNTASNALGTILAQIACFNTNDKQRFNNDTLNTLFTYERIIDDCFYQGVIRSELHQIGKDQNWNIFNLEEHGKEASHLIYHKLKTFNQNKLNVSFNLSLPFNRLFEIKLKIDQIEEIE